MSHIDWGCQIHDVIKYARLFRPSFVTIQLNSKYVLSFCDYFAELVTTMETHEHKTHLTESNICHLKLVLVDGSTQTAVE